METTLLLNKLQNTKAALFESSVSFKSSKLPNFSFSLEINGIKSLADYRSPGILLSLLLNLRNGSGVPERVNKHWSSKEVVATEAE